MSSHKRKWAFGYHQDIGKRPNQEDCAGLDWEGTFCLCDGMGGHSDGEKASKHIIKIFIEKAKKIHGQLTPENIEEELSRALEEANQDLQNRKSQGKIGTDAGCTFLAACIIGDLIYFLSVGDSLILADKLSPAAPHVKEPSFVLNKDVFDSKENELVKVYGKSPEEAKQDPRAHALTRAITGRALHPYRPFGSKEKENVPHFLGPYKLEQGSRIILASDGILSLSSREDLHMLETQVRAILQRCPVPNSQLADDEKDNISRISAEYLIKKVLEKNKRGQDNVSVMLIDICADDGCMEPDPNIEREIKGRQAKSKSIPLRQRKGEVSVINDSDDTPHYSRSLFGGKISISRFVLFLALPILALIIAVSLISRNSEKPSAPRFVIAYDKIEYRVDDLKTAEIILKELKGNEYKLEGTRYNLTKEDINDLFKNQTIVQNNESLSYDSSRCNESKDFLKKIFPNIAPISVPWNKLKKDSTTDLKSGEQKVLTTNKAIIDSLGLKIPDTSKFNPESVLLELDDGLYNELKEGWINESNVLKKKPNENQIKVLRFVFGNDIKLPPVPFDQLDSNREITLIKDNNQIGVTKDTFQKLAIELSKNTMFDPEAPQLSLNAEQIKQLTKKFTKENGKYYISGIDDDVVRVLKNLFPDIKEKKEPVTEETMSEPNSNSHTVDKQIEPTRGNGEGNGTGGTSVTSDEATANDGAQTDVAEITAEQIEKFKNQIAELAKKAKKSQKEDINFEDISIEGHYRFKIKAESKNNKIRFTIQDFDQQKTIADEFDHWYDNEINSPLLDDLLVYMCTISRISKDYEIRLDVYKPQTFLASYDVNRKGIYTLLFALFKIKKDETENDKLQKIICKYQTFIKIIDSIESETNLTECLKNRLNESIKLHKDQLKTMLK